MHTNRKSMQPSEFCFAATNCDWTGKEQSWKAKKFDRYAYREVICCASVSNVCIPGPDLTEGKTRLRGVHFRAKRSPKRGQLNPAKNSPKEVLGGNSGRLARGRPAHPPLYIIPHPRAFVNSKSGIFEKNFLTGRAYQIWHCCFWYAKMQDASCNPAFYFSHSLRTTSGLRFTQAR